MADYKELLRKAVEALPENNGAARRAVYEKARAALVGQLRAINPPLPARDITTHRLQLEDCIRQVEQEASEANIAGLSSEPEAPPTLPPVFAAEAKAKPAPAKPTFDLTKPVARAETPKPAPSAAKPTPAKPPQPARPAARAAAKAASIEDIIADAERDSSADIDDITPPVPARAPELKPRPAKSQPVLVAKNESPAREPEPRAEPRRPAAAASRQDTPGRALPSIVARAEAAKGRPVPSTSVVAEPSRRGQNIEPRRDSRGVAAARQVQPMAFELPDDLEAMSSVREVEVDQHAPDPQGAIDRAIATLETEARSPRSNGFADVEIDEDEPPRRNGLLSGRNAADLALPRSEREGRNSRPAKEFATPRRSSTRAFPDGLPRAQSERRGFSAVTIFVVIFAVLLLGVGGAGFWAWQEGFLNLDAMFGKGTPAVAAATKQAVVTPDSTGPGNTETAAATTDSSTQLKADRLPTVDTAASTAEATAPLALQAPAGKTEERLGADTQAPPSTAEQAVAAVDPASVAGSQSLLLEAADNGQTGATPFSGTVDWSKGVDELGQPTLVGKASIPARNLSVDILIRKNADPSLPASHLMEINFSVADTFVGGSIAGLPGVLLKNEELVQGAPLVGASARVVGNSFLFALSAAQEDATANVNLLTSRKWMDLALIYASGKRAIITLEKDDKAQQLFADVFAAWGKATKG